MAGQCEIMLSCKIMFICERLSSFWDWESGGEEDVDESGEGMNSEQRAQRRIHPCDDDHQSFSRRNQPQNLPDMKSNGMHFIVCNVRQRAIFHFSSKRSRMAGYLAPEHPPDTTCSAPASSPAPAISLHQPH
mmetsp:Transcript_24712/g.65017  ORF Transcript_24712/g.65017 Transcript_24712/m.65017 type:complete len:132 (-) Transcript_24712:563-958(-)